MCPHLHPSGIHTHLFFSFTSHMHWMYVCFISLAVADIILKDKWERIIWLIFFAFINGKGRGQRWRTSPLRLNFRPPERPTKTHSTFAPLHLPHAFVSLAIFFLVVFVPLSLATGLNPDAEQRKQKIKENKKKTKWVLKIVFAEKDASPKRGLFSFFPSNFSWHSYSFRLLSLWRKTDDRSRSQLVWVCRSHCCINYRSQGFVVISITTYIFLSLFPLPW